MYNCIKFVYLCVVIVGCLFSSVVFANTSKNIPILCYHNFNPTIPGSMSLTPQTFETQLRFLKDKGFTVIPLQEAVDYLLGKRTSIPDKSVVITVDDGWQSVYKYLLPIVQKNAIPVTLFIYPQTISTGKNAMTWEELRALQKTGLFDIQSHTYDHPNFKHAKRQMSAAAYQQYVNKQLTRSKKILEEKLGVHITLLAWPFGIYNDELERAAADAGYMMAFTIDAKKANKTYRPMSQPRYMIVQGQTMRTFAYIIGA